MKRRMVSLMLAVTMLALPAVFAACDREIAYEKKTTTKSDGTVKSKETVVKEKPDGTIIKEETTETKSGNP